MKWSHGGNMRTYYVMVSGGSFKDRYEVKVQAKTATEAISIAVAQERYPSCGCRPARPDVDRATHKGIRRDRRNGWKWSELAWHYGLSVPTVKKYYKKPLTK